MKTIPIVGTPYHSDYESRLIEVDDYIAVGSFVKIVDNKAVLAVSGDTVYGVAGMEGEVSSPSGAKLQQILFEGDIYCKTDPTGYIGVILSGNCQIRLATINGATIQESPTTGFIVKL